MPILILCGAALVVALDQVFKFLVSTFLKPVGSIDIIPGLFKLDYVQNKGAAFGMLANARWIFIAFTIIITLILIYVVIKKKFNHSLFNVSAVLIIGGGIGNLIDRIFLGYVIDYLSVSFFPPVCNFADYCITIGAVLLIIYFGFIYKSQNKGKA